MARKTRRVRLAAVGTAALLSAAGFLIIEATSADAGGVTRYVATNGDDTSNDCTDVGNPCKSIQYAVDQANVNDTVSIASGTYNESVFIRISLTVVGAGATGAHKTTVDGSGENNPTFFVDGTDGDILPTVTFQELNISENALNGGVLLENATGIVLDCVVSNNHGEGLDAQDDSSLTVSNTSVDRNGDNGILLFNSVGKIDNATASHNSQSGIADEGFAPLHVTNSTLSHNGRDGLDLGAVFGTVKQASPKVDGFNVTLRNDVVNDNGEGVSVGGANVNADHLTVNQNKFGGFVSTNSNTTISSSTFDSNVAVGVASLGGPLKLITSTVSNTEAAHDAELGSGLGAGVIALASPGTTINTSTLYANTGQDLLVSISKVTVKNSTLAGTKHEPVDSEIHVDDGALVVDDDAILPGSSVAKHLLPANEGTFKSKAAVSGSDVKVSGTLIGENPTKDCVGALTDSGYNLADDDTCGLNASTSKSDGTTKLGAFGSHGGPTDTLVPLKGSDAIDQIPTGKAGCASDATDQRGEDRLQGPKCDIGAVEVHQTPVVISPASLPHGSVNVAYSATFSATGGLGAPYEFSLAPGSHLPDGLTLSTAGVLSGTPTAAGTYTFTISVDDPTLKTYTLVIGGGAPPLANTGTKVSTLLTWGGGALVFGVALLLVTGYAGRRREQ